MHAWHTNRLTSEEHFASFRLETVFLKRGKDCFTESGSGLDGGDVLDVVDDERFNSDVLGSCWSLSVLDLKCQFSLFVNESCMFYRFMGFVT